MQILFLATKCKNHDFKLLGNFLSLESRRTIYQLPKKKKKEYEKTMDVGVAQTWD